ncbi:MAG: GNAT family protein [Solirubrobacteraceae bacterium]
MSTDLPPLVLTGAGVRLEPLAIEHVSALVSAATEDRSAYGFSSVPATPVAMSAWVQAALAEQAAGGALPFVTHSLAHERIVGSTRFYEIALWQWPDGDARQREDRPDVCEIGYTWLAASEQRTACNTEAKLLMLSHAFDVWEVHRVAFRTDRRNERSRLALERIGAQFEGIRRAERPGIDGTIRDAAFYSIVAAEWPEVKALLTRRLEG